MMVSGSQFRRGGWFLAAYIFGALHIIPSHYMLFFFGQCVATPSVGNPPRWTHLPRLATDFQLNTLVSYPDFVLEHGVMQLPGLACKAGQLATWHLAQGGR